MHSRIIQLSTQPLAVKDKDFMATIEDHSFVGGIADYIDDQVDVIADLDWFVNSLPSKAHTVDTALNHIEFHPSFVDEYFNERKNKLIKMVDDIKKDPSLFHSGHQIYSLTNIIENDYGFYICFYDEGNDLIPLDRFIRDYLKVGVRYYFGGTIDYHF